MIGIKINKNSINNILMMNFKSKLKLKLKLMESLFNIPKEYLIKSNLIILNDKFDLSQNLILINHLIN